MQRASRVARDTQPSIYSSINLSLQDILAQSSAGVFDAACRENAFFLGSTPADAYSCANDTLFYRNFYERACVQGDIACSQYGSCYHA